MCVCVYVCVFESVRGCVHGYVCVNLSYSTYMRDTMLVWLTSTARAPLPPLPHATHLISFIPNFPPIPINLTTRLGTP